jgi:hypothetical protein
MCVILTLERSIVGVLEDDGAGSGMEDDLDGRAAAAFSRPTLAPPTTANRSA